jgi:hypothetical protein
MKEGRVNATGRDINLSCTAQWTHRQMYRLHVSTHKVIRPDETNFLREFAGQ